MGVGKSGRRRSVRERIARGKGGDMDDDDDDDGEEEEERMWVGVGV